MERYDSNILNCLLHSLIKSSKRYISSDIISICNVMERFAVVLSEEVS